MKRLPFLVCLAFMLILFPAALASAAGEEATNATTTVTTSATTAATTTTPEMAGGSVYFETDPAGATIWVDYRQVGTSDLTYYSEKTGTLNVLIRRKGYEDFSGTVTVAGGRRVEFYAKLTPLPRGVSATETTPPVTVITATTIRKSTLTIPTPWPTTTQSMVDPAVVTLAAAAGLGIFAIRRR